MTAMMMMITIVMMVMLTLMTMVIMMTAGDYYDNHDDVLVFQISADNEICILVDSTKESSTQLSRFCCFR